MENTAGLMAQCLREILSKEVETDMGCGEVKNKILDNFIKAIICLIKSMDMEFTIGETGMFTKVFGWMIYDMEKELCHTTGNYNIMGIGKMEKKLTISPNLLLKQLSSPLPILTLKNQCTKQPKHR
jgi:hypothetical protein